MTETIILFLLVFTFGVGVMLRREIVSYPGHGLDRVVLESVLSSLAALITYWVVWLVLK